MTTTVYGASDDLVEVEGDISGEIGNFNTSEKRPVYMLFSDGTKLDVWYGNDGAWRIKLRQAGHLLLHIDPCEDPATSFYSDVAYFLTGLTECWESEAEEGPWETVK